MKTVWKLNCLSIFYALSLFIMVEFPINVYRLERLTGIANLKLFVSVIVLIVFILSSAIAYFLTKRKFNNGKIKYTVAILWIPYFLIFVKLFAAYFPITNPQEVPLPGVGIVIIFVAIIYPLYIGLMTFLASLKLRNQ